MANSLLAGVSGLNSHQQMLNVIGNNIANLNTTGYKARTTMFSELFYESLTAAAGGTAGIVGGVNPSQIGTGSRVAQIDLNLNQGNFDITGNDLDLAIDGDGYFVVKTGRSQMYTRAGTFRIDSSGYLVDPSTGARVQRFGTIGEPDGINPAYQTSGNGDILIPIGTVIAGQETTTATLTGNLPYAATGPLSQILESSSPLTEGGNPATAATLLNDLDLNTAPYQAGDEIIITGTDADGSPINVNISVDGTTTLGTLVTEISNAFAGATATLGADGRILLESDTAGPSYLSLGLRDEVGNAGSSTFAVNTFVTSRAGKNADTFQSAFQVYDGRGDAHTVSLTFTKQPDDSWTLDATIPSDDGTVIDGSVTGIRFNDDGTFASVSGTGTGDASLTFHFAGQTNSQTISLSLGTSGTYDGLTSVNSGGSISATQDGFEVGSLSSVRVSGDGIVEGIATNGRTIALAQLAIATFANPNGLNAVGQNYFDTSASSGEAQIGTARSSNRGSIRAGELEQSNVDLALEFTRLIVAQRGFSANARTITVSSEILEELTNLIR